MARTLLNICNGNIGDTHDSILSLVQYQGVNGPGWVLADGSSCVGSKYNTITGEVNVPDLRGRARISSGLGAGLTNRLVKQTGGAETHTLITSEMPTHNHGLIDPGHDHSIDKLVNGTGNTGTNILETPDTPTTSFSTGSTTTGITIQNSGSDGSHNNMQPFYVTNVFIKIN